MVFCRRELWIGGIVFFRGDIEDDKVEGCFGIYFVFNSYDWNKIEIKFNWLIFCFWKIEYIWSFNCKVNNIWIIFLKERKMFR